MAELVTKYQQYEEYKDIQNEWISSVPSDWKVVPLKALCLNPVKDGPHETPIFIDEGIPFLSVDGIQNNQLVFEGCRYISAQDHEKYSRKCAPAKGDVLLGKAASVGKVAYVETEIDFNVWSPLAVITPKTNKLGKYIFYAFQSTMLQAQCDVYSNANTQKNLGMNTIDNLHLPFPSYEEAEVIATFLDHETAQIDTLIEKQQTLIQLLKEKRQAVISHAVTKGLNPDAPMKDSGVEWLGEVPEHWDIVKLKWKASTTSGGTPTTSKYEDYYEDGDIPWIRTTDLNNDKLNETPIMITPKAVRDSACSLLPKNSVLIAMYGGAGSIGKHSLLNFESTINQAVCGVLPSDAFVPDYLHRFYEFYRPFWMIGAAGTRKDPNIGQDNIKEARVPIPPLSEQHQIADYLDKMQSHFDALTESAEKGIQLMQERRTALISAAVTGKIDVRGWQAPE